MYTATRTRWGEVGGFALTNFNMWGQHAGLSPVCLTLLATDPMSDISNSQFVLIPHKICDMVLYTRP